MLFAVNAATPPKPHPSSPMPTFNNIANYYFVATLQYIKNIPIKTWYLNLLTTNAITCYSSRLEKMSHLKLFSGYCSCIWHVDPLLTQSLRRSMLFLDIRLIFLEISCSLACKCFLSISSYRSSHRRCYYKKEFLHKKTLVSVSLLK